MAVFARHMQNFQRSAELTISINYNRNEKYFVYYCELLLGWDGILFLCPLLFEKSFVIMNSRVCYESDYQSNVTEMIASSIGFE